MARPVLIIPCFNEAARLDEAAIASLAHGLDLVLVDDGSTDATVSRLDGIAALVPGRAEVLRLARNRGKGEAVRAGLNRALARGAHWVGFADADLSTPPDEILRVASEAQAGAHDVVLAARVKLLGTDIRRHAWRHYLGRVFQTAASVTLRLPVYDSQCGCKFFRAGPALLDALSRPFASRWAFDVELMGRLLRGSASAPPVPQDRFVEIPLRRWVDVKGSKLRPWSAFRAALDLLRIALEMRRR